jgi:mannose-6-phosphate isomerase-like protein (cupin superfamily)
MIAQATQFKKRYFEEGIGLDCIGFLGILFTVLADCHATNGCHDLLECTSPLGLATPWAWHTTYDLRVVVLTGEFTVHTDTQTLGLPAGQSWLIPKGVGQYIINSGAEVTTSLALASPSGFAQLVRTSVIYAEARSLPPAIKPNFFVLSQAAAEVGDEVVAAGLADDYQELMVPADTCCLAYVTGSYFRDFMHQTIDYYQLWPINCRSLVLLHTGLAAQLLTS